MKRHGKRFFLAVLALSSLSLSANAADQTQLGAANGLAIQMASKSPLVRSAFDLLRERLRQVHSKQIREAVVELMDEKRACIQHRANLDAQGKADVIAELHRQDLLTDADAARIDGGAMAGVFPPVLNDGTACPHMPQAFFSAPGGATSGHHSEPGGLPVHEAFNDTSALGLAQGYHMVYGTTGPNGLPIVARQAEDTDDAKARRSHASNKTTSPFQIDSDVVLAAPMWHDWGKTIVFQWNQDGSEFTELNFGGNGKTDDNGKPGDSRTGSHHILGLAEGMKRGLAPDFMVTVASAHSVPTLSNEYKVVNWLRAAAVIAHVDPVAKGYLQLDAKGQLRLPAVRHLGEIDLTAAPSTQPNMLVEYVLHNLSDADYAFTGAAASDVEMVLAKLAPEFGYTVEAPDYRFKFRHPVLTYLSAERLFVIYSNAGLDAVRKEVAKLRKLAIL
jgi:hypothetical protein